MQMWELIKRFLIPKSSICWNFKLNLNEVLSLPPTRILWHLRSNLSEISLAESGEGARKTSFSIKSRCLSGMFEKILRMLSISFIVHRVECVASSQNVQNKQANPSPERCLEMRTSCRRLPKQGIYWDLTRSLFSSGEMLSSVFVIEYVSKKNFHPRRKFVKIVAGSSCLKPFSNSHTLYLILGFANIRIFEIL